MAHSIADEIIDLSTSDLADMAPRELRAWISHVVVHAMMGTPAGHRIDRPRLQALVEKHYDELLVGDRLDFAPVLAALLRVQGVFEEDLYVGVVSLIGRLASVGIRMEEPKLRLTALEKSALLDAAYSDTQQAKEAYDAQRHRTAVHELHRKRLGELLVEQRLIDEAQLLEGLEAQQEMGGRLGSNLVRLGYLDEEQLAAFLGRQLGLPCITRLEGVAPEAVRRIPPELAQRYEVIPISVSDRELGLAMADPANLEAIDAVGFTTGLRIRPAVAPEVLIQYALARFYGVRNPIRLRRLDLHRAKIGSTDIMPGPWSISLDLLTADVAERAQNTGDVRPPKQDRLGQLAADLADVRTRGEALDAMGHYLSETYATTILLEVDGTRAFVRSASGIPQTGVALSQVQIDVHQHPVLSDVFLDRGVFVGAEPHGQTWLSDVMSVPRESLFHVIPVLEHEHVIALAVGNARRIACADVVDEDRKLAQITSTAVSMTALRATLLRTARRE